MSISEPAITVLMAVYNGERYLAEAVDSILAQTFTDFEFLIIDDGSTDRSLEILKSYSDPRMRIVRNEKNLGLIASLNRGLSLAKGEYIARMDADDISMPQRLEKQFKFMIEHPDAGVLGGRADVIDANGEYKYGYRYPETHGEIIWGLCFGCVLVHPSVMFKTNIILSVGGYDKQAIHNEDISLWTRLMRLTRFANMPEVILLYRRHDKNVSVEYRETQLENTLLSYQTVISSLLEMPVPVSICRNIHENKYRNSDDAMESAQVIQSLFEAINQKVGLTSREKSAISRDAARRMLRIAWQIRRSPKALKILTMALRLDPACLTSASGRKIIRPLRAVAGSGKRTG